jgi:hypothetical protein
MVTGNVNNAVLVYFGSLENFTRHVKAANISIRPIRTVFVGTYPPVRISKDMLYVILISYGSRRMDSGALDEDLEEASI